MANHEDVPQRALRIRSQQDFWSGIVLLALSALALYATYDLGGMRGSRFGPGTAPRLFASVLGFLGLVVVLTSLFQSGPTFPRYRVRGPLFVTASILLFATLVELLGLVLTSFIAFMFAAAGSSETRWIETTASAVALTAFCVILFVYLLKLPFLLWPRFALLGLPIPF
jgi:putative tricarboxylic transport membrane protein